MGRYAFHTAARNQDATGLMKPSVELRNAACVIAVQHRRMKKRAVGIKPLRQTRRFVGQQSSARGCPRGTQEKYAQLPCRTASAEEADRCKFVVRQRLNRACLEHANWNTPSGCVTSAALPRNNPCSVSVSTPSAFTFTLWTTPTNRISRSLVSSSGICEYPPISTALTARSDAS